MGVPSFFLWLINTYGLKNIVQNTLKRRPNNLYIDANCAMHPVCFETLKNYTGSKEELENTMMENIIKYIEEIIKNVNPTDKVFIAVDGVAPAAKIQQQRKRRYKTVVDNEIKDIIKKKHGIIDSIKWNNIVITPGTEFMEKMHEKFLSFCQKHQTIKLVYSSYHEPGEGEHKILKDIRICKKINNIDNINNINIIYGLDADLIFLSFASQIDNIYLYRENQQLTEIFRTMKPGFCYVNIDMIKDNYFMEIQKMCNIVNLSRQRVINDFIFLCFFIGNDFIPNIPYFDIKNNGLQHLVSSYVETINYLNSYLITETFKINEIFLEHYFEKLIKFEKIPHDLNKNNKKCTETDEYKISLWKLENMKFSFDKPNFIGKEIIEFAKSQYYSYYFGIDDYYEESVSQVVENYLEGLEWITKYYFATCCSWSWYYIYHNAPYLSDIYNFIKTNKFRFKHINFSQSKPFPPFVQLLLVVPYECRQILPNSLQKNISENFKYRLLFPQKIILDLFDKHVFWKCTPFLSPFNLQLIYELYTATCFTNDELKRNVNVFSE